MENLQNWNLVMRKLSWLRRNQYTSQMVLGTSVLENQPWPKPCKTTLNVGDLILKPYLKLASDIAPLGISSAILSYLSFITENSDIITLGRLSEVDLVITIPRKTLRGSVRSFSYLTMMRFSCIVRYSYVKVRSTLLRLVKGVSLSWVKPFPDTK